MITTSSILGQFDRHAGNGTFPDLNNGYVYPADVRLHLFGDTARWAMVVEILGYNPREAGLSCVLYRYGNCLTGSGPGYGAFLDRVDNMDAIDPEDTERYVGGVPLVVNGTPLTVTAGAGTPLQDVFRELAPAHRELLLADGTELREEIPADLPLLLRLEEWNQPEDLSDSAPGDHETFRLLAEVLESGDPARYRPTLPPNTHWSNWPEAGTL
ncbi:hypothetical protein ABZ490_42795 [Streptomyces sp. NPDC005811]|uniref:DUF7003 family protein n=1 Tax=Streptomyces sp. NPDC005811 TaxID=3154565 RepID=UPI0033EFB154